MAALVGLALLGQVCFASTDVCAEPVAEAVEADVADVAPAPNVAECDLPLCGPLGRRLYCIEGYESRHFGGAYNRSSGAAGWLQWLPSTARRWGVLVGDRQSEWSAAARIAGLGEAFFTSQWVPLQRGLC